MRTHEQSAPAEPTVSPTVVAIVPAFNSSAVVATVESLLASEAVSRVVVVDDGSEDDPTERLVSIGAVVARLPGNRGKGAAVEEGLRLAADADVVLLVDADLGATAAHVVHLIPPVVAGSADMAVAAFPPAGGRAGFGIVKRWSAAAVRRFGGAEVAEPLSGQRAIVAERLRKIRLAPRFGLEVALGIDFARDGGRIVEIPLPLDHAHTGRSVAGFRHRGRQAVDISRSVVARIATPVWRRSAMVALAVLTTLLLVVAAPGRTPRGEPLFAKGRSPIVLVSLTGIRYSDLESGRLPNLQKLLGVTGGVLAARTPSATGDLISQFATLGAGATVLLEAPGDIDDPAENTGLSGEVAPEEAPPPDVVLVDEQDGTTRVVTSVTPSQDRRSYGELGLLGDAVHDAGLATGYVGARSGPAEVPGAVAVMDTQRIIDVAKPGALPDRLGSGTDAAIAERVAAVGEAAKVADVVLVDAGRAAALRPIGSPPMGEAEREEREALRIEQLAVADRFVGQLAAEREGDPLLVFGLAPPARWRLTPIAASGANPGSLTSPSTKRPGEVVLTDIAPTVLATLDVDVPNAMVGAPAEVGPGPASPSAAADLDKRTDSRERSYVPVIWLFVSLQGVIYLGSLVAFRRSSGKFANGFLHISAPIVLASTAFPVVTFLYRLAPVWAQRMPTAILGLVGASALVGWWARSCRRFPLSPLTAIAGLTTLTLMLDAAFGGWLQHVSLLGYTPITAARFYGMGNMGFAILGASALMLAGSWVDTAPVRRDGLVAAGCLLWVVTLVEMLPDAGADFGAAVVFVPVFILVMIAWSGIRVSRGRAVLCALAIIVAVAVAVAADLKLSGGTHLGRFASSDGGGIWDVVLRKLQTNLRVMRITTWTWMVPIIVAFIFGSFLAGGGSARWFGDNRVWRTTFVALLGFGVLGGLLNDSGVVIPALVLVYVGAVLFMVQDRHAFSPPVVTIPEGVEQPLDAGLAPNRLISATAPEQSA